MSIEPLTYKELIVPGRLGGDILMPNEIPIHQLVYISDSVYTQDFIEEVHKAVSDSIKKDVSAIEKILKKEQKIKVIDNIIKDEISCSNKDVNSVNRIVDEEKKKIDIQYVGSSIGLNFHKDPTQWLTISPYEHPVGKEKLEKYSYVQHEQIIVPTWYIHNLGDNGFGMELYFRNFAIMFNNIGLEKINRK